MQIEHLRLGELDTNCYIIVTQQNNCVIIDPAAQPQAIIRFVEERGCTPAYLMLTHCHHDHIGAVKALREHFGAKTMMSEIDYRVVQNPSLFGSRYETKVEGLQFALDAPVKDGDVITLDELAFEVLLTPGHSAGGVCYRCGEHLFTGDTLFEGTVGRTDLYGGDFSAVLASVKRLAALPGNCHVYPGHGQFSTMERERAGNPYINGTYLEMDEY